MSDRNGCVLTVTDRNGYVYRQTTINGQSEDEIRKIIGAMWAGIRMKWPDCYIFTRWLHTRTQNDDEKPARYLFPNRGVAKPSAFASIGDFAKL